MSTIEQGLEEGMPSSPGQHVETNQVQVSESDGDDKLMPLPSLPFPSSPKRSASEKAFVAKQIPPDDAPKIPDSPNVTRLRVVDSQIADVPPRLHHRSVRDTVLRPASMRLAKAAPRLIQRNLPYNQSHNHFNVKNRFGQHRLMMLWNLYKYDWFHVMLRWPTWASALLMVAAWTCIILIFGGFYMLVDRIDPNLDCGLAPNAEEEGPIQWHSAFAFSLETCTTVGYGLPGSSSAFFQNCPEVQVTIYFQMLVSMMFNAFLLAFFFSRLGRCETRAYQVVFTDKAVIRRDYTNGNGRLKFECKVYDADSSHPVVEAHVRMYVVHCRSPSRNYSQLRITSPNDDLGATLCTSIPTHISHYIDLYSPLLPPEYRLRNLDKETSCNVVNSSGLILREVDSFTGNREGIICPVCGESYGTFERLEQHVRYNRTMEEYCGIPHPLLKAKTHHMLDDEKLRVMKESISLEAVSYEDINRYMQETKMEVVVLVEGIDPLTSGTFQALHSYQAEDIFYGGQFAVSFNTENVVDFELFQTVELVEPPHGTNGDAKKQV